MSEKSASQLEEATQSPPDQISSNRQRKERRRARLYKAACFYFAYVMANNMHKYAVARSQDAQQTRWNELIVPVNARLSPWIMLFSAPIAGSSRPHFMDTTAFFVVTIFSFIIYARFYYQWNQHNDRYQLPVLVVAALVGLVPALLFDVGVLISLFCVTPKIALSGLLVSDFLHLAFYGPWQKEHEEAQTVDEEKGSTPVSDKPANAVIRI